MKRLMMTGAALLLVFGAAPAWADGGGDGGGSGWKSATGVNGASSTGVGSVVVFTPVTVTQTQGLDFGTITSGQAGAVAIDAVAGKRAVTGGVGAVMQDPGQSATFAITGQANAAINVVVSKTIVGFAGGITGVTQPTVLPTVLKGNTAVFSVGGALTIPAKSPAGVYTGTYQVAVNYP